MQSLVSGSECSTSSNPITQLAKHGARDFSDSASGAFAPAGASQALRQGLSRQAGDGGEAGFFQDRSVPYGGQSFSFTPATTGVSTPGQAAPVQQQQPPPSLWQEQFKAGQYTPEAQQTGSLLQQQQQQQQQQSGLGGYSSSSYTPQFGGYQGGMYDSQMAFGGGSFGMGGAMAQMPMTSTASEVKGKDRFVELNDADWEAQFARISSEDSKEKEPEEEIKTDVDTTEAEKKLEALNLNQTWEGIQDLNAGEDIDLDAFEAEIKAQATNGLNEDELLAKWEREFSSQFVDDSRLDDEFEGAHLWTPENVDEFLRQDNPYPFAEENKYLDPEHEDPYAVGQRLLREGAPLSEAALAFEAACQKDPSRGEAWLAAGETWAADERESRGIRALEKAVACGGESAMSAWMSLAVAYVNEGQELRALATLEKWITTTYPSLVIPGSTSASLPPDVKQANPWVSSSQVIQLFLSAARSGPSIRAADGSNKNAVIDPEVQVGLGVLFYSNSEYDRAKDCFEAALSVRPDDFVLWNRLGATLANGGHPEDAIFAYRKALELRPTFTRAIYNLGVSCLNIGCYHEAAEHLLAALKGQKISNEQERESKLPFKTANDDGGSNLWHTLRRAFLCMERHDLADAAHPGTPLETFSKEGFEF